MLRKILGAATALLIAGTGALALAGPAAAGGRHHPEKCYEWVADTFKDVPNPNYVPAVPGTPGTPGVPGTDAVPAVPEVPAVYRVGDWWVWAPTLADGPQDYTPAFPGDERGKWVGPKTEGGPDQEEEGTFNVSHGESGNSSWFHRGPRVLVTPAIPGTPAIAAVPAIPAVPATPGTPAIGEPTIRVIDVPGHRVEVPCTPPPPSDVPVPALFSAPVTAPTCDTAGSFLVTNNFPNVNVTVSPAITGPGTYTLTFTLVGENVQWPDETTAPKVRVITIAPATGVTQSTNPQGPCYQAAPPPPTTPPATPPVTTPPVVTTVYVPVPAPTPTYYYATSSPTTLASTGSEGAWVLAAGALVLLGIGTALTVARRRYSRV